MCMLWIVENANYKGMYLESSRILSSAWDMLLWNLFCEVQRMVLKFTPIIVYIMILDFGNALWRVERWSITFMHARTCRKVELKLFVL